MPLTDSNNYQNIKRKPENQLRYYWAAEPGPAALHSQPRPDSRGPMSNSDSDCLKRCPGIDWGRCLASVILAWRMRNFINQILSIRSDPPVVSWNRTIGFPASSQSRLGHKRSNAPHAFVFPSISLFCSPLPLCRVLICPFN